MLKKLILGIAILIIGQITNAQTKLATIFSDHMVLQQNQNASIWGTDTAKESITVEASWGEKEKIKADKNGNWKLKIKTPLAGGPYSLTINGSEKIVLNDVMIGEVWLCSGQSNMEMPVKGNKHQPINGSQEAILNSLNSNIRLFTIAKKPSMSPLSDVSGSWKTAEPNTTRDFSATAYFFGKKLETLLNVPVGLIVTSWGASSAEAWTDNETLKEFKTIEIPTKVNKSKRFGPQQTPTALYNGMLHPIIGYSIKGAIWYQGESNITRANEYNALVQAMVTGWRKKWNQGDFSFYSTQIAPFNYGKKTNSAYLREAQLKTSLSLKNTGMAVTLDIGDPNYIHPREKKIIGDRLAYWALAKNYNIKGIEFSGPIYKSMKVIKKDVAVLTFQNIPTGMSSFGKPLVGFEVAGEDRIFYPAKAKIIKEKDIIEVTSTKVKKPAAVRYAFKNNPEFSLFSSAGLPASSFRTDNW